MLRLALLVCVLLVVGSQSARNFEDPFLSSSFRSYDGELAAASSEVESVTEKKDREELSPNYKDPAAKPKDEDPETKPKEKPSYDPSVIPGGVVEVNANGGDGFPSFGGLPGFGRFPGGLFNLGGLFGPSGPNVGPWWKGDNVCVERSESTDDEDDEKKSDESSKQNKTSVESLFSASISLSNCFETPTKYECVTKVNNHGVVKTFVVRYKCCYGYQREENSQGCTKKLDLKPLLDTIDDVGGKEFKNLVKSSGMENEFETDNITVFVPSDDALTQFTDKMLEMNQVDLERRRRDAHNAVSSPDLIKSHIIPGFLDINDLVNEQVLNGENNNNSIRVNLYPTKNYGKMVTVNCLRISKENNLATNGIAHVIDGVISPVPHTLKEIIEENPHLTYFRRVLEKTDLFKNIKDDGHYTIFAPSDEAFNNLDERTRAKLMKGEQCAKSIVKNHVVLHTVCSSAIVGNATTHNVAGDSLFFERDDDGTITIDGTAKIVKKDIVGKNGVIHLIDKILVPDSALHVTEILNKENFTVFEQLVKEAGLESEIDSLKNATIFAPSDKAFSEPEAEEFLKNNRNDPEKLKEFVLYHTTQGKLETCDMYNNEMLETNDQGKELRLNLYSTLPLFANIINKATVNCARLTRYDEKSCGSVIHEVDRILLPPSQTILDIVNSNKNYSTLASIIKGTEAEDILSQNNQSLTLVAPTNEAFEKLDEEELNKLKEDKKKANTFVQNHILKEVLCCTGVGSQGWGFSSLVPTISDQSVQVSRSDNNEVHVGRATVTKCDVLATNGIVHSINRVLLPRRTRLPAIGFFLFDI